MVKKETQQKKPMPPPGRKLSVVEALAWTNRKFGKALAKLALAERC
jgi:hypothetical protein